MMNLWKKSLVITFIFILISQLNPVYGELLSSENNKYALIIGINDYINLEESDGDLVSCENDARFMKNVLINYYGFKEENIMFLLSQEATKEKIREAFFSLLVDKCKEGDGAVLFYSGHGTQVEDLSGDESDSYDEALCPADIERGNIKKIIIDDEFGEWISQVKTDNFTIILDSCFSGTSTKEGEQKLEKFNGHIKFFDSGFKGTGGIKSSPEMIDKSSSDKYTVISACASDQSALEIKWTYVKNTTGNEVEEGQEVPPEETFYSGVLARNLIHSLSQFNTGNITYKELMSDVINKINYQGWEQKPGIEGNYNRFIFSSSFEPSPCGVRHYFHITGVEGDRVQLDGGFINGVETGSIYEVYPSDEIAFSDSGTGKIEINEVSIDTCSGKILEGNVEKNGKAVQVAGLYQDEAVVVYLDNPELTDFLSGNLNTVFYKIQDKNIDEIKKEINDDKKIEILKLLEGKIYFAEELTDQLLKIGFTEEEADMIKDKTLQKLFSSSYIGFKDVIENADLYMEGSKDENNMVYIDLYDYAGRMINSYSGSVYEVFATIRPFVDNSFAIKQLHNFSNPSPDFNVRLWTERDNPVYIEGEEITYYFESEKDCYLTLIDVGTDGSVTILYPNNIYTDNKIEGGKTCSIPSAEDGIKLTVEGPGGRKIVKAIATEKPLELAGYIPEITGENFTVMAGNEGGCEFTKNIFQILAKSLAGGTAKSMAPEIIPLNNWATAELVVLVREY